MAPFLFISTFVKFGALYAAQDLIFIKVWWWYYSKSYAFQVPDYQNRI